MHLLNPLEVTIGNTAINYQIALTNALERALTEYTMHIKMFSRMPTQEDIDKKLAEYFSRLDPLSVGILAEIEMVKQATGDWNTLSQSERDERLDAHFIPKEIQNKNSRTPIYGIGHS